MSKEEILQKCIEEDGRVQIVFERMRSVSLKAMDEYAKQCLMDFKKFCDECTFNWEMGDEDFNNWPNMTQEEVIDNFLQSQNKTEQL